MGWIWGGPILGSAILKVEGHQQNKARGLTSLPKIRAIFHIQPGPNSLQPTGRHWRDGPSIRLRRTWEQVTTITEMGRPDPNTRAKHYLDTKNVRTVTNCIPDNKRKQGTRRRGEGSKTCADFENKTAETDQKRKEIKRER